MAQDEYGNEIDDEQQQQQPPQGQGTTSKVAAAYNTQDMTTNNTGIVPPNYQAPQETQAAPPPPPPQGGFDRTQFRDQSMSRQQGQTAEEFIAQNGGIASGVRLVPGSKDKVILPTGEVLDISIDASAEGRGRANGWTGMGHWENGRIVPDEPGGGGGGAAPGSGGGPGFGGGGGGDMSGQAGSIFDIMMQRARQSQNIDRNDPIVRAQSDAFNAQGQSARRDFLAKSAESAGPYGNQRSEERRSAEELGKSSGQFEAQAIKQQQDARRSEIENALSGAAGFLTEQQRMALQRELTTMQLNQQESQFGRSLGEQGRQFDTGMGQRAYEYDTGRFDDMFL